MMKKFLFPTLLFLACLIPSQAQSPAAGWGNAKWIWDEPDAQQNAQTNDPRFVRLTFALPSLPSAAALWITVDNHYVAYVNGHKVGEDGEWNTLEKIDVAKHLIVGKNVLAIQATNKGGVAGAIARLHIKTVDKKDVFVVTNEAARITRERPGQDWLKAEFDDAAWFAAVVLGDTTIGPWNLAGGGAVAQIPGKGPKAYGSTAVDPKITKRLSAQEQAKHFIVPKDFEIELVAADPVVINPITMVLDDKGRVIVSESHTYRYGPSGSPIKPYANPVVRLDPDGKGGFTRLLVADGFTDPVMGIAVKGDKLWLSACDYLYTYDIDEARRDQAIAPNPDPSVTKKGPNPGLAINKKTLLADKNKAWNPFGMFVLEWGPDGKLYMSVGNHNINIEGPDGKISARGGSGLVMRMNPDGTKMERLVHGLRVPYSFDFDPFGQLWVLSNGEGNPNRFVRVLDGVDYHCYSRGGVDNNWLAGNHPLAPPSEEVHDGAHTQFMRYYSAAYPQEYQGNLFACNWGRHGFAGGNRGIFRFVLDERNNIVKKDTLVTCTDPHFRPAHIVYDTDGSILIADWYGRDDESDMTGRIWRLKYVGKDRPDVKHKLDAPEWKVDDFAIEALGSPSHLVRDKAAAHLIRSGGASVDALKKYLATTKEPLGAAQAIWTLMRMDTAASKRAIALGNRSNIDWKVRRLVRNLDNQYRLGVYAPELDGFGGEGTSHDVDPAVDLEARKIQGDLSLGLFKKTAADPHLRYEAAWHLAKRGTDEALLALLTSEDANVRLAGLIAIDVACYENFPSKKAALAALGKALENPGKLDHQLLLMVAQLDGDASIVPGLEKLIAREDLPTATIAKAVLVLKAKSGGSLASSKLSAAAGKRLIEAVEKGSLKIASPADQLVIFEFLESEGPTPFALKQIEAQLRSNQPAQRQAAHTLARRFGPKSAVLAAPLWASVLNPKTKFEEAIEHLSTIARVEEKNAKDTAWKKLLEQDDPWLRAEAVRWWRQFKNDAQAVQHLVDQAPALVKKDERLKDDLAAVFREVKATSAFIDTLPALEKDKETLGKFVAKELAGIPEPERAKRAAMGLQVFERNACTKCHTTATQTTPLAPSLKGIAGQKVDYLIESVLYPSKIIKTGFETEIIELKNGKTLTGLVKDEGKVLRVLNLDRNDTVNRSDIESRTVSKTSVMPEGQETTLSRRELVDLVAYLMTLK